MTLRHVGEVSRRQLFARFRGDKPQFRLPWAKSADVFVDSCTRCLKCMDVCPEKIIVKGSGGFPVIEFGSGGCTFCAACADICSDGCFSADRTPENAWNLTVSPSSACVESKGVSCRLCEGACDVSAIRFRPRIGGGMTIHFDERCTGCGACLPACPVSALSMTIAEVHA